MEDLRIFLSYNLSEEEMVVIGRLESLAAEHGITLYVPLPAIRRGDEIAEPVAHMIDSSNLVVVFCTQGFSGEVRNESNYAMQKGKPLVLVVENGVKVPSALKTVAVVRFEAVQDHIRDLEIGFGAALLALWLLTSMR